MVMLCESLNRNCLQKATFYNSKCIYLFTHNDPVHHLKSFRENPRLILRTPFIYFYETGILCLEMTSENKSIRGQIAKGLGLRGC